MLKIREPIKTSLRPGILAAKDGFTERIKGNYMQLGEYVDETDLLHLVTQPPEVFVMNGGMTGIINNSNVENNQIRKVNVVNNLVNRIMISADAPLSYQDNVYITNILHKLGIRDEKKFLNEVYSYTENLKQQDEMINLYWENLNEIRSLVEEYTENNNIESKSETKVFNENVLHLHEEVNRRLQSAAIYQILQNFYENNSEPGVVSETEYRHTEFERFARQTLLTRLRESARNETQPLVYRHENIYEGDIAGDTLISEQEITERINSAVLLELIEKVYESSYSRSDRDNRTWLSTENVYYGGADNTLFRIENNTAYLQYLHEQYVKNEERGDNYSAELNIVRQLLAISENTDLRLQISQSGNLYESRGGDTADISETDINIEGDTFESAEMTLAPGDTVDNSTEINTEQRDEFTEAIYQTYQQNIARNERYMQSLKNILNENAPAPQTQSPAERTMKESRLSLEHPEQFKKQFEEEEKREAERLETIRTETEKLLPQTMQVTNRLIREYIAAPERFYMSERISEGNMGLLLRDIQEAESEEVISHGSTDRRENSESRGEEGTLAGENTPTVYPPSTDTTVPSSYPSVIGNYTPNVTDGYNETFLQNIFPVFARETYFRDRETTVEVIAREVKERTERIIKENAQTAESGEAITLSNAAGETAETVYTPVRDINVRAANERFVYGLENILVNNIIRRMTERLTERQFSQRVISEGFEAEQIPIVHRSQQTFVSEEQLEDIRQEVKRIEETQRQTTEKSRVFETENRTVINSVSNETIEQNAEQIRNIVNRSVRAQIDSISDKVYGRIERQLRNEQRRRGL